jgi:hypothetical protein
MHSCAQANIAIDAGAPHGPPFHHSLPANLPFAAGGDDQVQPPASTLPNTGKLCKFHIHYGHDPAGKDLELKLLITTEVRSNQQCHSAMVQMLPVSVRNIPAAVLSCAPCHSATLAGFWFSHPPLLTP